MDGNIKLPKKIVVDASLILASLLPDEKNKPLVRIILQKYADGKVDFLSLHLLDLEVLNGIRSAILTKRIQPKIGQMLVNNFLKLKIEKKKVNLKKTYENSLKFNLSIYDAAYLTLAKETRLRLLTMDKNLGKKSNPVAAYRNKFSCKS